MRKASHVLLWPLCWIGLWAVPAIAAVPANAADAFAINAPDAHAPAVNGSETHGMDAALHGPAAIASAGSVAETWSFAGAVPPKRVRRIIDPDDVSSRLELLSPIELDEVIWLARCIYSESDRPHEQELVAWVVRNRVETEYRGRTYREVILEAKQFSAFNEPSKRRDHILSLSPETPLRSWQRTLEIALNVYEAPASDRPFSQTVRHFYSPVSMVGGREPHWVDGGKALSSSRLGVDRRRFIFFDDVDSHLAGLDGSGSSTRRGSELAGRSGGDGFNLKLPKPSGKVSRPKRPTVQVPQSDRRN